MDPSNTTVPTPTPTLTTPPVPVAIPIPAAQIQQPAPTVMVAPVESKSSFEYASTWSRILASFIDGLVLSIPSTVISFVFGLIVGFTGISIDSPVFMISSLIINLLSISIFVGYYIYFIGSRGQTLGKMAMKIKVVKESDGTIPGYGSAFLREVVGKFVSGLVLSLGYLWMIWDSKKQGWHDKISQTVVIKVQSPSTI